MAAAGVTAALVDVDALLKVIVGSLVLGIGVTSVFALAIHGATRFSDLRQGDRRAAAGAYGVLAAVSVAAFFAAVAVGIIVMTTK